MDSRRRGTKGKLRAAFFNPKEKRQERVRNGAIWKEDIQVVFCY